jgi:phosphatidylethanolamine-binding protein (PEBP) family uncharacterized protein
MVLLPALLIACAGSQVDPSAADLGVAFSWRASDRCSSLSPEIRVTGFPPATRSFQVKLVDLDVPTWNHGGGSVANDNSGVIRPGALKSGYNGPCPPSGRHRYQFTVKALDVAGNVIGIGKAVQPFP